ncbi:hypothetical protein BDK51DRAFT_47445 [Blyttiomyces helicus]|uniref:Uncharacterized protein n=1 Tax=Blyttiomyces helicus TaxID=388810 RepID=A0A4V1IQB0_9FUNG|nr:hypothetical protein BDK51DRAFT_47445 [Blyttiomyces helicus]|eukprot:RKO85927.1 hypothetical protein BDK51DRAFT_47445 [Blyttiomyces helicus]
MLLKAGNLYNTSAIFTPPPPSLPSPPCAPPRSQISRTTHPCYLAKYDPNTHSGVIFLTTTTPELTPHRFGWLRATGKLAGFTIVTTPLQVFPERACINLSHPLRVQLHPVDGEDGCIPDVDSQGVRLEEQSEGYFWEALRGYHYPRRRAAGLETGSRPVTAPVAQDSSAPWGYLPGKIGIDISCWAEDPLIDSSPVEGHVLVGPLEFDGGEGVDGDGEELVETFRTLMRGLKYRGLFEFSLFFFASGSALPLTRLMCSLLKVRFVIDDWFLLPPNHSFDEPKATPLPETEFPSDPRRSHL